MNIILIILYVLISSFGMILLKSGGQNSTLSITASMFGFSVSWKYLLGLSLYVVSFVLWMIILQKFKVAYISPVAYGLVYLCILILSGLILHEKVTPLQIVGGSVIILGILLASIDK